MKFEDSIKRLEEIVGILENGEPELEKALELFREGASLVKSTASMLENAEQEVKILMTTEDGELSDAPFDEE